MGLSSRSRRAFWAFLFHLAVVETNTPPENSVVEYVVMNWFRCSIAMVVSDA